jgi:hypothetical protein
MKSAYELAMGRLEKSAPAVSLTEEQKAQRLAEQPGCRKNKRTFWSFLLYSRIVAWGQDFKNVKNYIRQNMLEALGEVAYKVRAWQKKADGKAKKKSQ